MVTPSPSAALLFSDELHLKVGKKKSTAGICSFISLFQNGERGPFPTQVGHNSWHRV